MATTDVAALWVPDIWIRGVNEGLRIYPALITSGAVVRNPTLDAAATGGGKIVNLPFFKDITDQVDEVQTENQPAGLLAMTGGRNAAPILNRQAAWDVTALASAVTGEDVVGGITGQLAMRRLKARQNTVLAILRGLLGSGVPAAGGAAAILKGNRNDIFVEDAATAAAANKITAAAVNATIALIGENSESLQRGAMLIHPLVHAQLKTIDSAAFTAGTQSGAQFQIQTYQGIPVFVSNLLSRGATNGNVYETYFLGPGVFGWGEKPQVGDQVDAASLQLYLRKDLNNIQIYDRTRYLIHVNGTQYNGAITPGTASSASNVDLSTIANWTLAYSAQAAQSCDRIPIACLRSNV
jgi:hypothetical protein